MNLLDYNFFPILFFLVWNFYVFKPLKLNYLPDNLDKTKKISVTSSNLKQNGANFDNQKFKIISAFNSKEKKFFNTFSPFIYSALFFQKAEIKQAKITKSPQNREEKKIPSATNLQGSEDIGRKKLPTPSNREYRVYMEDPEYMDVSQQFKIGAGFFSKWRSKLRPRFRLKKKSYDEIKNNQKEKNIPSFFQEFNSNTRVPLFSLDSIPLNPLTDSTKQKRKKELLENFNFSQITLFKFPTKKALYFPTCSKNDKTQNREKKQFLQILPKSEKVERMDGTMHSFCKNLDSHSLNFSYFRKIINNESIAFHLFYPKLKNSQLFRLSSVSSKVFSIFFSQKGKKRKKIEKKNGWNGGRLRIKKIDFSSPNLFISRKEIKLQNCSSPLRVFFSNLYYPHQSNQVESVFTDSRNTISPYLLSVLKPMRTTERFLDKKQTGKDFIQNQKALFTFYGGFSLFSDKNQETLFSIRNKNFLASEFNTTRAKDFEKLAIRAMKFEKKNKNSLAKNFEKSSIRAMKFEKNCSLNKFSIPLLSSIDYSWPFDFTFSPYSSSMNRIYFGKRIPKVKKFLRFLFHCSFFPSGPPRFTTRFFFKINNLLNNRNPKKLLELQILRLLLVEVPKNEDPSKKKLPGKELNSKQLEQEFKKRNKEENIKFFYHKKNNPEKKKKLKSYFDLRKLFGIVSIPLEKPLKNKQIIKQNKKNSKPTPKISQIKKKEPLVYKGSWYENLKIINLSNYNFLKEKSSIYLNKLESNFLIPKKEKRLVLAMAEPHTRKDDSKFEEAKENKASDSFQIRRPMSIRKGNGGLRKIQGPIKIDTPFKIMQHRKIKPAYNSQSPFNIGNFDNIENQQDHSFPNLLRTLNRQRQTRRIPKPFDLWDFEMYFAPHSRRMYEFFLTYPVEQFFPQLMPDFSPFALQTNPYRFYAPDFDPNYAPYPRKVNSYFLSYRSKATPKSSLTISTTIPEFTSNLSAELALTPRTNDPKLLMQSATDSDVFYESIYNILYFNYPFIFPQGIRPPIVPFEKQNGKSCEKKIISIDQMSNNGLQESGFEGHVQFANELDMMGANSENFFDQKLLDSSKTNEITSLQEMNETNELKNFEKYTIGIYPLSKNNRKFLSSQLLNPLSLKQQIVGRYSSIYFLSSCELSIKKFIFSFWKSLTGLTSLTTRLFFIFSRNSSLKNFPFSNINPGEEIMRNQETFFKKTPGLPNNFSNNFSYEEKSLFPIKYKSVSNKVKKKEFFYVEKENLTFALSKNFSSFYNNFFFPQQKIDLFYKKLFKRNKSKKTNNYKSKKKKQRIAIANLKNKFFSFFLFGERDLEALSKTTKNYKNDLKNNFVYDNHGNHFFPKQFKKKFISFSSFRTLPYSIFCFPKPQIKKFKKKNKIRKLLDKLGITKFTQNTLGVVFAKLKIGKFSKNTLDTLIYQYKIAKENLITVFEKLKIKKFTNNTLGIVFSKLKILMFKKDKSSQERKIDIIPRFPHNDFSLLQNLTSRKLDFLSKISTIGNASPPKNSLEFEKLNNTKEKNFVDKELLRQMKTELIKNSFLVNHNHNPILSFFSSKYASFYKILNRIKKNENHGDSSKKKNIFFLFKQPKNFDKKILKKKKVFKNFFKPKKTFTPYVFTSEPSIFFDYPGGWPILSSIPFLNKDFLEKTNKRTILEKNFEEFYKSISNNSKILFRKPSSIFNLFTNSNLIIPFNYSKLCRNSKQIKPLVLDFFPWKTNTPFFQDLSFNFFPMTRTRNYSDQNIKKETTACFEEYSKSFQKKSKEKMAFMNFTSLLDLNPFFYETFSPSVVSNSQANSTRQEVVSKSRFRHRPLRMQSTQINSTDAKRLAEAEKNENVLSGYPLKNKNKLESSLLGLKNKSHYFSGENNQKSKNSIPSIHSEKSNETSEKLSPVRLYNSQSPKSEEYTALTGPSQTIELPTDNSTGIKQKDPKKRSVVDSDFSKNNGFTMPLRIGSLVISEAFHPVISFHFRSHFPSQFSNFPFSFSSPRYDRVKGQKFLKTNKTKNRFNLLTSIFQQKNRNQKFSKILKNFSSDLSFRSPRSRKILEKKIFNYMPWARQNSKTKKKIAILQPSKMIVYYQQPVWKKKKNSANSKTKKSDYSLKMLLEKDVKKFAWQNYERFSLHNFNSICFFLWNVLKKGVVFFSIMYYLQKYTHSIGVEYLISLINFVVSSKLITLSEEVRNVVIIFNESFFKIKKREFSLNEKINNQLKLLDNK